MIDCHCHMLPGIDDGAHDVEQALRMASVAVQSGVSDIILTPHHNDGMYVNLCEDIINSVSSFQLILDQSGIALRVHPGSELHVVPELPEHLEAGIACTYANKNKSVLLELPKHTLPTGAEQIIEHVAYLGLTPVIAHPERNSILCNEPQRLEDWHARGWKFQLTNQSVSGEFGKPIQDVCRYWMERGWIQFIASDAHRSKGRSPDMRKGVEQIEAWFGEPAATLLSRDNPGRLIKGEPIVDMAVDPQKKAKSRGKKRFWFWR